MTRSSESISPRLRPLNPASARPSGRYVLYWMVAYRRTSWNFALDRAAQWCRELGKPLLVFEPLRAGYRWACDRFHHFLLQGMADNQRACADAGVVYLPYLEPEPGDGKGLLEALAEDACVVVTDDHPGFFYPRMLQRAAAALGERQILLEAVDSNGLLPVREADRVFARAYDFRRHLQRQLLPHLESLPAPKPLNELKQLGLPTVSATVRDRWRGPSLEELLQPGGLAQLPIDHGVRGAVPVGGAEAGDRVLREFLDQRLGTYADRRNDPDADACSQLSPYLHFGHVSAHRVFGAVAQQEDWTPDQVAAKAGGQREGWWGMGESAEAFLDQLITWREIGFNRAFREADYDQYPSLPPWARATLEEHAGDPRRYVYDLAQFEQAQTHDPLWNAAQRQLVTEGRIHNYLRMLWGKKILEWTAEPPVALQIMLHLNDKYALDGRDPNSVSGITWCLGRYDRAWGPERPIFGKIRFMSSENTARKVRVREYLDRYGP